jgi:hypothetical protein
MVKGFLGRKNTNKYWNGVKMGLFDKQVTKLMTCYQKLQLYEVTCSAQKCSSFFCSI